MRKKIFALALAGAMAFAAFPAMAEEAGFVENEIFSDEELDFINLSAVWFQAVPMENETMTYSAEDADIHIEADISALENDLGYPVGEWVPYLTVDYKIEDQDGVGKEPWDITQEQRHYFIYETLDTSLKLSKLLV